MCCNRFALSNEAQPLEFLASAGIRDGRVGEGRANATKNQIVVCCWLAIRRRLEDQQLLEKDKDIENGRAKLLAIY